MGPQGLPARALVVILVSCPVNIRFHGSQKQSQMVSSNTRQMSWITVLPSHSCGGTLQNLGLDIKLAQLSADVCVCITALSRCLFCL